MRSKRFKWFIFQDKDPNFFHKIKKMDERSDRTNDSLKGLNQLEFELMKLKGEMK